MSVVLCGLETGGFISVEEHRFGASDNKVTTMIFGPKRDVVTGRCRNFASRSSVICIAPHILL
jgi:hypothetical protein